VTLSVDVPDWPGLATVAVVGAGVKEMVSVVGVPPTVSEMLESVPVTLPVAEVAVALTV
jgi:hypothetical protein